MLLIVSFAFLLLFSHQTDGANSITWYEPPPVETTTNNADIKTDNIQLVEGSTNVPLSWNFTLGQNLNLVVLQLLSGSDIVATITPAGQAEITVGYSDRFSVSWINSQKATLVILKVTANNNGEFSCKVTTLGGGSKVWTRKIKVNVVVAPTATIQQCLTPVTEGDNATLYCNATGNPPSSIAWIRANTRKVLSSNEMHMITAVKRNESGSYECHASNGIGNNSTKSCTIDVQYRAKIVNLPSEYNVTVQQSVSLYCEAEGNPTPSFRWTPCKDGCNNSTLVIPEVLNDTVYTCKVSNVLNSDSATTSVVIAGKDINITLTITGESCTDGQYNKTLLENRVTEEIDNVFANENAYDSTTLKDVSCGSLIVDLSLKFSSIVSEKWVISILKEATKDGKLGEFNVAASSIKGTRPVVSTTTSPPTGKTTPRSSDDTNIGLIVGCAVGGFIALVIIIAVIIWCVRKNSNKDKDKKKKSKTSNKEVSDNDAEGHRMAQFQEGRPPSGYGNNGYEDTGSTSRPTAANAGKKDKKGKKKRDEPEKPVGVVYAQVDKSKRTSKPKEPENLYDQAERPNSRRPGELQYVSPEDLHQGHSMPRNSAAQPKKPEAYTETQYAVLV